MRSFDERHHGSQGYVLRIDGIFGDQVDKFLIAISKGANKNHRFCVGMEMKSFKALFEYP